MSRLLSQPRWTRNRPERTAKIAAKKAESPLNSRAIDQRASRDSFRGAKRPRFGLNSQFSSISAFCDNKQTGRLTHQQRQAVMALLRQPHTSALLAEDLDFVPALLAAQAAHLRGRGRRGRRRGRRGRRGGRRRRGLRLHVGGGLRRRRLLPTLLVRHLRVCKGTL